MKLLDEGRFVLGNKAKISFMGVKHRLIFVLIVFTLGIGFGVLGVRVFLPPQQQQPPSSPPAESVIFLEQNFSAPRAVVEELPFSLDLLQNPVLTLWSAAVSGKIIAKTDDSFTISHVLFGFDPQKNTLQIEDIDDAKTLRILYISEQTEFRLVFPQEGNLQEGRSGKNIIQIPEEVIDFADLPIGVVVEGNVTFREADEGWEARGSLFNFY